MHVGCRIVVMAAVAIWIDHALSAAGAMDLVRQQTRADEAIQKYGLSGGRGVAIAVLDRGIDWRHPDFIRSDGKTRIRWLLDMSGQNYCNAGNPAPREISAEQIDLALAGGPDIDTRDAVGHGTVTTGVAAGNGSAAAGGKYRGMAPLADLIIVKITSEGAPAHDGMPAEAPFVGCIDEALDWVDAKATELDEPLVALINHGVQWGPIDGTSAVSRKIDEIFGMDRPGRAYVAASGDEGGLPNHAGGTFTNTSDTIVNLSKSSGETVYMQMWYTGSRPASLTFSFDDGGHAGPVAPAGSVNQDGIFVSQYAPGAEFYPWKSTSGDRAVWIRITGHTGSGHISIRGTRAGTGRFDLYSDTHAVVAFEDHLVPGRLTDYSGSLSAIVAGCHVLRTTWIDLDGVPREYSAEGSSGELWTLSSGGPTRDGRLIGVDVTAPGQNLFAAYGQGAYWTTFRFNLIQDGAGFYGRHGATSGSAPIVLGAAALMMELRPSLTGRRIRQLFRDTAVHDGFTGQTPNANWGYGKLDLLAAMDGAVASVPDAPQRSLATLAVILVVGAVARRRREA